MEPKRITDDKHAIILQSPRTLQRKGDLIINSQKLLGLKDVIDILKKSPPEIKSALCGKSLPSSLVS